MLKTRLMLEMEEDLAHLIPTWLDSMTSVTWTDWPMGTIYEGSVKSIYLEYGNQLFR